MKCNISELQIRGEIEDNSKIIVLFLNKNICCDPSLEPSRCDGSNDGYNISFKGVILKIILKLSLLPFLSGALQKVTIKQ